MTPEQIEILIPAFAGFHQDFDLDDVTERDVLTMYARGLDVAQREPLYAALEALLTEAKPEGQFDAACWAAGAHYAPARAEVESFVAWARTPTGAADISGPGPTSEYVVVSVSLDLS